MTDDEKRANVILMLKGQVEFCDKLLKYLEEHVDNFQMYVNGFMREETTKVMKRWGVSDEDIKDACDWAELAFPVDDEADNGAN